MDIIGLQPRPALVADHELGHAHVAPDIAAQALDPQAPEPSDLEPVGGGLDQQPRLRQQRPVANPGDGDEQKRQEGQGRRDDGLGKDGPPPLGHVVRRGQKLCPMLT